MKINSKISALLVLPLFSGTAFAATPVQEEPGVAGFFLLGAGALSAESNMIATTFGGSADIGDDTIDDPTQDPDSESSIIPLASLSLTYTFDNRATEIFFGSSLEDFLQFDFASGLGVRHQIDKVGIFEVSALSTPLATEVWEDPYVAGVSRDETDRTASGVRVQWGSIMGSGFDVRVSAREVEIDDERSGDALVANATITTAEQQLLDRNGDISVLGVAYNWDIAKGKLLVIGVNSVEYDLDGDAMSYDGTSVQLTYSAKIDDRQRLVGNVFFGSYDFDEENPIVDETDSMDQAGFAAQYFLVDPFGLKGWTGNIGAIYADSDHDIDFYNTNSTMVNVGIGRRF